MEIREPRSISPPPDPHLDAPPGEASAAMMALCTAGQGPARSSSFRFGFEERHGICFRNTERDLSSKATSVTAAADTPQCTPQPPNPSACALLRRYDLRSRTSWRHRRYRAYAGISLSPGPGASDRLPVRPQSSTRARETSPQPRPAASCLLEVTRESNSESDLAGRRTCTGKGDSESDSPRDSMPVAIASEQGVLRLC